MEDTIITKTSSSTTTKEKEVTAQGAPYYSPAAWSFNEAIRAILRCLGLENTDDFQPNPCSTPKKEDDGNKAINNTTTNIPSDGCQESPAVASTEEGEDPPSTSDPSDPVTDPPADDPPSTTADPSDSIVVSFSAPARPGTGSGSGSQIN